MKITFAAADTELKRQLALAVALYEGQPLSPAAKAIDRKTKGALARALAASRFEGKRGEIVEILAPAGLTASRLLLVGFGLPEKLTATAAQQIGGALAARLQTSGEKELAVQAELARGATLAPGDLAAHLAFGAELRAYRFDKYQTKTPENKKPTLAALTVLTDGATEAKAAWRALEKLRDGVFLTRDLVSEPANIIYPESLAAECGKLAALGVTVEVLGVREMKKLGMGALLGVGQGSAHESKLVVLQWKGGARAQKPVVMVGKGVCFDSGGISIKPAGGMEDMKWDMGGAGVVIGLFKALAGRKAKANVVGVVGLVENMPSGTAQRPGDVVTSMSGQTIEVINTDAEGRLVLADAVWYAQDRFKPQAMIDLATLTGAIIVSLGDEYAGLFANNDDLAAKLTAAGQAEDEKLWRLPMGDSYDRHIDSQIADMKNTGEPGKAGSIAGAQFIQRFVNGVPWAHLDIAGVVWSKKDTNLWAKGGTGFGVRLLNRFIADNYEGK